MVEISLSGSGEGRRWESSPPTLHMRCVCFGRRVRRSFYAIFSIAVTVGLDGLKYARYSRCFLG